MATTIHSAIIYHQALIKMGKYFTCLSEAESVQVQLGGALCIWVNDYITDG